MTFETGFILNNRYRILKLLGQGSSGAVYKTWDLSLSRTSALKENLDTSEEAQQQFLKEATILARLSHPNLPRITDYFIIPDQGQYLIMDYIEGDDLQKVLEQTEIIPAGKVKKWILQIMDALQYLHAQIPPVLHRDIKPANIRITSEDKAYLVDFGLVKDVISRGKTDAGVRTITPGYSPPEQYGQAGIDARSDMYALGATLYTLLTGIRPPESIQRSNDSTLRPVSIANPAIPIPLSNVVMQAMSINPFDRFSDISEMRTALENTLTEINPPQPAAAPIPQPVSPVYAPDNYAPPPVNYAGAYPPPPAANYRNPNYPPPPVRPPSSVYPGQAPAPGKKPVWMIILIIFSVLGLLAAACVGILLLVNYAAPASTPAVTTEADSPTQVILTTELSPTENAPTAQATIPVSNTLPPSSAADELQLIFDLPDGSLYHDTSSNTVEAVSTEVNTLNFILKADVQNPYGASEGSWDFGILFREADFNDQFRLSVLSEKEWVLSDNQGNPDGETIAKGHINNLKVKANEVNSLMLAVYQGTGWFFMNGQLISVLPLDKRIASGNIELATGLYKGNERKGAVTSYKNFKIWQINVQPQSGFLTHNEDSYIEEYGSKTAYKNFITTASFKNPYLSTDKNIFSYGYIFRSTDNDYQYRLTASGNQFWELTYNTGSAKGQVITNGNSDLIKTSEKNSNKLDLITLDSKGWFFINDTLIQNLDLSGHLEAGEMHVGTGFYADDEISGKQTDFQDFILIPLP